MLAEFRATATGFNVATDADKAKAVVAPSEKMTLSPTATPATSLSILSLYVEAGTNELPEPVAARLSVSTLPATETV